MRAWIAGRLTYANVVSTLCLAIILGGSAVAATQLANNSVRSRHIKNGQVKRADIRRNAVDSARVANGALRAEDFALGQAPTGPPGTRGEAGPQGPGGPQGPSGPAGSDAQFNGADAGGDLTGQFPDPLVGPNAIGTDEVAANSLSGADIEEAALNVVDGLGSRTQATVAVNANSGTTFLVLIPGVGSVSTACPESGGNYGLQAIYSNTAGTTQNVVGMSASQGGTTTVDGERQTGTGTFTFVSGTSPTADHARRFEIQVGNAFVTTTIEMSGLTNYSGAGDCFVMIDVIRGQ